MPHCRTNSVTGVLWIDSKVVLTKSIITFPLSEWRLDRMARVGSLLAELYSCCQVGANICKYSIIIHIRKLIQFKNPTASGAAMARTKQSRRDTSRTVFEHYSFQSCCNHVCSLDSVPNQSRLVLAARIVSSQKTRATRRRAKGDPNWFMPS